MIVSMNSGSRVEMQLQIAFSTLERELLLMIRDTMLVHVCDCSDDLQMQAMDAAELPGNAAAFTNPARHDCA